MSEANSRSPFVLSLRARSLLSILPVHYFQVGYFQVHCFQVHYFEEALFVYDR